MKILSVQRRDAIRAMLIEKESITINEVMEQFDISVETARRDFDYLANEGFLNKIYGGATLKQRTSAPIPKELEKSAFSQEKDRIAKRAVKFLKSGDTIFLDGSDTVSHMYRGLMNMDIIILTNSLAVINYFKKSKTVKVICVGGRYDAEEDCFLGPACTDFFSQFTVDRAFMSCKSISRNGGIGVGNEQIASVIRTVIAHSQQSYMLVDHSKFGKASFIRACEFEDISCIFTDHAVTPEWDEVFQKHSLPIFQCTKDGDIDPPQSTK